MKLFLILTFVWIGCAFNVFIFEYTQSVWISVNLVNFVIFIKQYLFLYFAATAKFLLMGHVINLIFTCLINYMLFDCNDEGRKLRWSLKEFDPTWPFQGSCPSANLKCPGELKPTQASFVPPLLSKYKKTRNLQIPSSSAHIC